ncbi:hypothetical protein COCMIDRAFT_94864, partial [Bipolaris oryzae ATCC 44560]
PVRSAVLKLEIGGLVVRWVTTGESPLSYVFAILFCSLVVQYVTWVWLSIQVQHCNHFCSRVSQNNCIFSKD